MKDKSALTAPIYTEPSTTSTVGKKRASLEEIYTLIKSDLTDADNLLKSYTRNNKDKINRAVVNGLLARTPEMAKQQGLVDIVAYEDVYHNAIKKALKVTGDDDYNKISILDYTQNNITTRLNSAEKTPPTKANCGEKALTKQTTISDASSC